MQIESNETCDSLADEKDIHCAKIELVEIGQSREAIICRVLAGVKLWEDVSVQHSNIAVLGAARTHHYSLALVLYDMT